MYIVTKESIVYILYMMSLSFLTRIKKRFVYFKFMYSYHNNLLNATKIFWFGGPWFIDMISKTLGRLIPNDLFLHLRKIEREPTFCDPVMIRGFPAVIFSQGSG
jgi:hypothetical protein